MNKIPNSFKIAGIIFKVDKVDNINNGSRYGEFNDCNNTIKIARKNPSYFNNLSMSF